MTSHALSRRFMGIVKNRSFLAAFFLFFAGAAAVFCCIGWLALDVDARLEPGADRLESLWRARLDLSQGALSIAMAEGPGKTERLDAGLALMRQAGAVFTEAGDSGPQDKIVQDFPDAMSAFALMVANTDKPGVSREERAASLRIGYHELDRLFAQAQASLNRSQDALAKTLRARIARLSWLAVFFLASATLAGVWIFMKKRGATGSDEHGPAPSLWDEVPAGVVLADGQGLVFWLNAPARRLTGWTREEARGRSLETVVRLVRQKDSVPVAGWAGRGVRENEGTPLQDVLLQSRDGRETPVTARVVPLADAASGTGRTAAVLEDMSGERERREALEEREAFFKALADAGPSLVWSCGPDAVRAFFNEAWIRFTGRTLEQERGEGWTSGLHPDDLPAARAGFARAFALREPYALEYRLRRADGAYRWILEEAVARIDDQGRFYGYVGRCLDITGRKFAEEALKKSEARFRAMAEAAPEGVCMETDGRFVYANPAAARLFGAEGPEELIGKRVIERIRTDQGEAVLARLGDVLAGDRPAPAFTAVIAGLDGASRMIEIAAAPLSVSEKSGVLLLLREAGERQRPSGPASGAGESAGGGGTSFDIVSGEGKGGAPARAPAPPVSPVSPGPAGPAGAQSPGTGARILLVEDDPIAAFGLCKLLHKHGYQTAVVPDGEAALALLQAEAFDLALMDLQLPGVDGLETVRRIRDPGFPGVNGRIPIIAVTAYVMTNDQEAVLNAGMDGYLTKPLNYDQLLLEISRLL